MDRASEHTYFRPFHGGGYQQAQTSLNVGEDPMKNQPIVKPVMADMTVDVSTYTLEFNDLGIKLEALEEKLGDDYDVDLLHDVLAEAPEHVHCSVGYRFFYRSHIRFRDNDILVGPALFRTGALVPRRIGAVTDIALYAASHGAELDRWAQEAGARGHNLAKYMINALGEVVVEHAAEWLERQLKSSLLRSGRSTTNRYDVGFCGWVKSDTPVVFSLFPKNFCGIKVDRTCTMKPQASLAGIIGMGINTVRRPHPCFQCAYEVGCVRRRT